MTPPPRDAMNPLIANLPAALFVLCALFSTYLSAGAPPGLAAYALIGWIVTALVGIAAVIPQNARVGVLLGALWCLFANAYLYFDWGNHLCEIGDLFSCGAVSQSAYATVFGVPVSLMGLGYYGGLALAAGVAPRRDPYFFRVVGVFSIASLAFSLYLASGLFALRVICPFCVSMYITNALLLWAAVRGVREQGVHLTNALGGAATRPTFVTLAAVFWAVVIAGQLAPQRAPTHQDILADLKTPKTAADFSAGQLAEYILSNPITVTLDGTEPSKGSPNANYTVIEFADFGCPHCAVASEQLVRLLPLVRDVQVLFKVFPLSGACNPALDGSSPGLCRAAVAAECAHRQGAFWPYATDLFNNQSALTQSDWDPGELLFLANDQGLQRSDFSACLADPSVLADVMSDARSGIAAQIRGTPSFFVSGLSSQGFVQVIGVNEAFTLIRAHQAGVVLPGLP